MALNIKPFFPLDHVQTLSPPEQQQELAAESQLKRESKPYCKLTTMVPTPKRQLKVASALRKLWIWGNY